MSQQTIDAGIEPKASKTMKYAHPSRVCVGVNNYKIILNIWTRADKTIAAMRASKAGKEKIPEPIIMPATSA